jgi:hypothetical protein
MTFDYIALDKFGEAARISNGKISFAVPKNFGPRILDFKLEGLPSPFLYDADDNFNISLPGYDAYGDLGAWHAYGGHRLWASPEAEVRTAYPDNLPVCIERTENGAAVKGRPQANNNIQVGIEAEFVAENKLGLSHRITNLNAYPIEIAAWPITVMEAGGVEAIRMTDIDTGLLPNRAVSLWPYSKMNDSRVYFGEKYITLSPDAGRGDAFKIGLMTDYGFAAYFKGRTLFIKRFDVGGGAFPDYNCNYETYTCAGMMEMESLGPLTVLGRGESAVHGEVWELHEIERAPDPRDEAGIDDILGRVSI